MGNVAILPITFIILFSVKLAEKISYKFLILVSSLVYPISKKLKIILFYIFFKNNLKFKNIYYYFIIIKFLK